MPSHGHCEQPAVDSEYLLYSAPNGWSTPHASNHVVLHVWPASRNTAHAVSALCMCGAE